MRRFQIKFRLTEYGKKAVACAVAGAAVLALLLFFVLFRVTRVEVVGSTKYTDAEIKEYAMENPLTSNTVLAILFKSHMEAEDIPFVESFDLERLNRNTIRIHVNEKKIVGYVIQGTDKLYFDKDGLVVEQESMNEEEIAGIESEAEELKELKAQALREEELQKAKEAEDALNGESQEEEEEDETGEQQDQQAGAQTLQAEEVNYGNESATEFHAAVTDVPRVIGLGSGAVSLGSKIKVEDDSVFNTILGITRIVEKYGILPEIVFFDENLEITLVYQQGSIHCKLGKDTLLEEKITRVAAILPKLDGLTGILHLEDYTTDTGNIIFSKESLYTLKSTVAAIEGVEISEDDADVGASEQGDADEAGQGDGTGEGAEGDGGDPAEDGTEDGTGEGTGDEAGDGTEGESGDTAEDGTEAGSGDEAGDGTEAGNGAA